MAVSLMEGKWAAMRTQFQRRPVPAACLGPLKQLVWCSHCCAWSTDNRGGMNSGKGTQRMGQKSSPSPWFEARERWSWMEIRMGSHTRAPLPWAGVDTPQVTCVVRGTNFGGVRNGECL